jgi:HK97 family phage portal protein
VQLNPFAALRGRSEQRSQDAIDALAQAFFYGGNVSASGVRVTPETALASVAVAACVEVRAETFSALPGGVFRKEDRKRVPVSDHDVYRLLFERPNDLMTSGEALRWKQIRQDVTGNAYFRVIWKQGRPSELWPLFGTNPQLRTANGKVAYRYEGDDVTPKGDYSARDILQFKGPFLKNPFEAASPIDLIRDTIGLSIATEQFFGRFLNNGSHFPTYLETDNTLTPDDVKAIANSLSTTAGVLGAGKTRIFDRGIKVKQNQMSLKDADLSGQMRWYLEQICRIYRVPLPLVQDWTHGTYTNSEQAGLWFAQHTITPIAVDTERVVRKLFISGEENLYVKWNVDAILRGDYTARTAGYSTLINAGVMSPNEARAYEDMDPYDGGDEYRVPLNTAPAGEALGGEAPKAASNTVKAVEVDAPADPTIEPGDSAQPRSVLQPVIDDVIDRIRIRAKQDAERGRPAETTRAWAIEHVIPPLERALTLAGETVSASEIVDEALGENRATGSIDVPTYVSENAARGVKLYEDGRGGDGLVDATIRDARALADGNVTEAKVRKIGPWIDRHLVDLDAPKNSDPKDPGYPGAGLVAMLLWGGGSTKESATRTRDWAYAEVERLDNAN